MALVPLSVLIAVETQPQALATILGIANALGLSTTSWQPLGMVRTILATIAQVVANFTGIVSYQAQGGYASLAAQMPGNGSPFVDAQGFFTPWMDLVSTQVFNVPRIPASFAQGSLPILNSTGSLQGPYGPGTIHAKDLLTGATYSNTQTVSILASSTTSVAMIADVSGSSSTVPNGTVLSLTTPITGCAPSPLTSDWVGSNAETNSALLGRCIAKLGSLSPNGAPGAYDFIAKAIPQAPTASAIPPYAVSSPITRDGIVINKASGVVQVLLANASGPAPQLDVNAVNAAIQAFAVPNAQTVRSGACTSFVQNVICTAYIPAKAGVTQAQAQAAAALAQAIYYSGTPVGGVTTSIPNQLPRDALISIISLAIANLTPAFAQQTSVSMAAPAGDATMAGTDVPIGNMTCTLVLT